MAASSSSSAAAAEPRLPKHDVFISFKRGDTRKGFTSHLYSALHRSQIGAYMDQVRLEQGSEISPELLKAIEESEISIIIFSIKYSSSSRCLNELVHILKCKKEKARIVLPIFLGIDPSHIWKQEGSYAAAFKKHEGSFESEKVREWRQALTEAAGLSGWNWPESVKVAEVVERVRTELDSIKSKRSDDLKGLVGIPKRLEKIKSFLDSPTVRIVGIWGMGGIGKTTLAKLVFKRFYNDFEGSYFAPRVRENAIKKGLDILEKEVFSELLGENNLDILKSDVNDRLNHKRILLVLDDVDDFEQLERLAGDHDGFGPGSKIIVTSRDLQVLEQLIDVRYEVQALDQNEASQLFYLKAFEENSCRTGYEEISAKVASLTRGNPLALQVLGSYLKSLGIKEWESALEKLERTPHVKIQKVLRISYDGLDTEEQDIFLDIACFLKDEKKDFVEGMLEHKSVIAITVLVYKSLITIDQDGLIRMHDLIQEMGWAIVRQSTKKLGKPSRLWIAEDVSNVLESNKGTETIEGIYLPWNKEDKNVRLRPDVFEEMRQLRLLKFYDASNHFLCDSNVKVYIDGDLKYLPNGLRYLHWEHYPGKSLPSNFKPQNLVELHMPCSKLEQLWDGVQKLGSLKHINLHDSKLLTKIPDLSLAPKLEFINLSYCDGLIHIPSLNLQATSDKSPYRRRWWTDEPGGYNIHAERSPGCIFLCACGLTTLPKVSGNITTLDLRWTHLKELPSSIESLENLLILDLAHCYSLERLPKLPRNIELLSLSCCSKLESFPMLLGVCHLTQLHLSDCNIREIPDWLGSLTSLVTLYLGGNTFDGIPASIGMLYKLKKLDISNCKNLRSLPELPLLIESVNAEDCSSLEMVSSSRSLRSWNIKNDSDLYDSNFSFLNCANLGKDAPNNIFQEFLYKVFCIATATTPPEVVHSKVRRVIGKVVVCYPTKEIPSWFDNQFVVPFLRLPEIPRCFNNQSEGSSIPITLPQEIPRMLGNESKRSSITITLPPNWYNPRTFLGFVVSVIAKKCNRKEDHSIIKCGLHLMTDKDRFKVDVFTYTVSSYSKHIVMWYEHFDHSKAKFEKYQEASLEFESNFEVKRCGVRMLYLGDAGTTATSVSWTTDDDDLLSFEVKGQSCGRDDDDHQSSGSDDDESSGSDSDESSGSDDDGRSCRIDDKDHQSSGSDDDHQSSRIDDDDHQSSGSDDDGQSYRIDDKDQSCGRDDDDHQSSGSDDDHQSSRIDDHQSSGSDDDDQSCGSDDDDHRSSGSDDDHQSSRIDDDESSRSDDNDQSCGTLSLVSNFISCFHCNC